MRTRSLVAAAVLAAATFFSSVPSASATTEASVDAIGDSASTFSDIISLGVSYG